MSKTKKTELPDLEAAKERLFTYKRQRAEIDARLKREKGIWKEVYTGGESSSWIFNSIVNKHADIIDSMPTCVCLPREAGDAEDAAALSKIIPVISQRCEFEQLYSDNGWSKLKHGTAIYGVFWNSTLEDGFGDIDIKAIPLEMIYWEHGVRDIQESSDLFILGESDVADLEVRFKDLQYVRCIEAAKDLECALGCQMPEGKALTVDWYYKKYFEDGRRELHYCKFLGDRILYSSEADPEHLGSWYEHGEYPIVIDKLYPTADGVCGFGLISLGLSAQKYINRLDENMLSYSDWASKVRFWAKRSLGVNEKEFLDLGRSIVEVEGDIDEEKLRQIQISPMDEAVLDVKKMKIDELKEITGSRDVSQGGIGSGVTAASAINILREAGAKSSRDGNAESYRAYTKIIVLIIELIRQFYDVPRVFRITGEGGETGKYRFVSFDGRRLREREDGRKPYFDIEVSTLKRSPTEASQKNRLAKELWDSGAFKRENAKETLLMLELMDFEGLDGLKAVLSPYEDERL